MIWNEEIHLNIGVAPIDENTIKSLKMVWSCSDDTN